MKRYISAVQQAVANALVLFLASACESEPATFARDGSSAPDAAQVDDAAHFRDASLDANDVGVQNVRSIVDRPDDHPGSYQVHVLYVEPADRVASPALDLDGTLVRAVSSFNGWLASRADGSRLRVDTFQGQPDITFVKLSVGESELAQGRGMVPTGIRRMHARLEALLLPTFNDPKKMYLIYYDGLSIGTCGESPVPGHTPVVYVGGIWTSTFLNLDAAIGDTSLVVHDPVEAQLPVPPFAARIGDEAVHVTSVAENTVTLDAPLGQAHRQGELLKPDNRPQDCRQNPFSRDGVEWTYATFVGLHEIVHALGMVDLRAPDHAAPPVAGAHLNAASPGGLSDLMYQGPAGGTCGNAAVSPEAVQCVLDPGHRNYYRLPPESPLTDLADSVFLEPLPTAAVIPPGW